MEKIEREKAEGEIRKSELLFGACPGHISFHYFLPFQKYKPVFFAVFFCLFFGKGFTIVIVQHLADYHCTG